MLPLPKTYGGYLMFKVLQDNEEHRAVFFEISELLFAYYERV